MEVQRLKVEIIGKGPSRVPVSPGYRHWYISTALDASSAQKLNHKRDSVWNIHKDERLIEPWFKELKHINRYFYSDTIVLRRNFGPVFSSTVSYMIAMACAPMLVDEILLNGIDLNTAKERQQQFASLMYFVGYARAKDIKVTTAVKGSTLLDLGNYS